MPRGVPKAGFRQRRKQRVAAKQEKTYRKIANAGGRSGITWKGRANRRNKKGATRTYTKNINKTANVKRSTIAGAVGGAAFGATNMRGSGKSAALGAVGGAALGAAVGRSEAKRTNKLRSGARKYEGTRKDSVIGKKPKPYKKPSRKTVKRGAATLGVGYGAIGAASIYAKRKANKAPKRIGRTQGRIGRGK